LLFSFLTANSTSFHTINGRTIYFMVLD